MAEDMMDYMDQMAEDISGMSPQEIADVLESAASMCEDSAGELDCKHKSDVASHERKMARILSDAAKKMRAVC